ncbi:hypothetical protein KUTeg_022983 [Tegillarca granosa]|uniref:Fatty acyl-CoA reductase n=1 Tax=Tegillarca granosa TaxID=220873 RepID=A0ABQ9E0E1_TEGGR|nr:hypothetical protein KUTeg_022983 [Tegillarca granosa]
MTSLPTIPEFYNGRSVLITGATGFMGKALVEKLLRSCPDLKTCYILIRPKKGKDIEQRLEELLNSKLFNKLRSDQPDFRHKVVPITGDILHSNLGISQSDEKLLIENTTIVFHSAATVKFDEEMKLSVEMNVVGVQRVIEFCKKLKKVEAFVHVSTAYANCDKKNVDESIYEPPLHPRKLMDAVEWMDKDVLETLTPKMGWVDNFNGPTGLLAAGDFDATADIIPVDLACNLMIAAAWYRGTHKSNDIPVFHSTTGSINRLTWGNVERMSYEYFMKNPVNTVSRIPNPRFTKSAVWHDLNILFDHLIPAYLMDFYMWISGKRPIFVKIQDRLRKAVASLDFFTSREWNFSTTNMYMLLGKMSEEDRKVFNFDPKCIDWRSYMEYYCLGTKRFVLKEEIEELPRARKTLRRLQQLNYIVNIMIIIVVWRLLMNRVAVAKSLWNLVIRGAMKVFMKLPRVVKSA